MPVTNALTLNMIAVSPEAIKRRRRGAGLTSWRMQARATHRRESTKAAG